MEAPSKIDAKFIISVMTGWVEQGKQISPEQWMDSALKLEMLTTYEHDKLIDLEYRVAVLLDAALRGQDRNNVSAAKVAVKSDPIYKEFRRQQLFVKQIDEIVRLAKSRAKLSSFT